jgi:hypothetical protein
MSSCRCSEDIKKIRQALGAVFRIIKATKVDLLFPFLQEDIWLIEKESRKTHAIAATISLSDPKPPSSTD